MAIHPNTTTLFYKKLRILISHEIITNKKIEKTIEKNMEIQKPSISLHTSKGETHITFSLESNKEQCDSIIYIENINKKKILNIETLHHYIINKEKAKDLESFWGETRLLLKKYNGITTNNLLLFLKECEFRINYGSLE